MSIYLRHVRLDRKCVRQEKKSRHLFSTSRLLDDAENHRSHWVIGTGDFSRTPVAYSWIANSTGKYGARLVVPYGLMLAYDGQTVWGVLRGGKSSTGYKLFADPHRPFTAGEEPLPDFRKLDKTNERKSKWSVQLPMRPRAILRAGRLLWVGGMATGPDASDPHATFEGRTGGLLHAMSAADGSKAAELKLPSPPIWDGLAAANGRLYVATMDGRVLCMGKKP
jgi:hypothetical protein